MITFRKYVELCKLIAEELTKNSLNIQRRSLPQIKDIDNFKKFLKDENINISSTKIETSKIKPTQKHLNPEKMANMIYKPSPKPILISKDNYIIDGHHRWAINILQQEKSDVLRVYKNFDDILGTYLTN